MKQILMFLLLAFPLAALAQDPKATDLRSILVGELRSTHNHAEWFVPIDVAVSGVTAEQAAWTDGKGNHSIGQLTYHLLFWNRRALAEFKGENPGKFGGNNDETFTNFTAAQWAATVQQLDQIMSEWEKAVQTADDQKLQKEASTIAHIATHNAYHIGQIVFVRKEQGIWDASKGVK
ncbi:MAG TPA: DinB family protein [Terriglobales bacterium]|jgi:hypothetical protein|nr:DinB family protein [Terriglobales bacterium]